MPDTPLLKAIKDLTHALKLYDTPSNTLLEKAPESLHPLIAALTELIKKNNEEKWLFASDAAHELRTPLAAIKTQAQVAFKANSKSESQKAIEKVLLGVERCTNIVQQLLILNGMPNLNRSKFSPLALNQQAKEILKSCTPEALEKSINIRLVEPKHPVTILGNATLISILIRNLLDNAIRYTPVQGNIKVVIKQFNKEKVCLKVIDDGPGIPKSLHKKVFTRFFRVPENPSPGSGLGLNIVQQIINLHQAKIELSKPKKHSGLEVCVYFACLD